MTHKSLSRSLLALSLAMYFLFSLAACSRVEDVTKQEDGTPQTTVAAEANGVLSSGEDVEYYVPIERKNPGDRTITLYIWNVDVWKQVSYQYRDSLTVQKLLEGLAYETNWNLSTAAVKPGDQTVTIWWDRKSSLYTGFPEKQAKEFMVFEYKDLDACILDSVKKTITENLGPSYSVFYANDNGGDLVLPNSNVTIPVDEPYSSFWDY